MPKQDRIAHAVQEHHHVIRETFAQQGVTLAALAQRVVQTFHHSGRLFVCGSGSLAGLADATAHLFLHRMTLERPSLPAISLAGDGTLALALARHGQGEEYYLRQFKTLAGEHDLLLVYADGSEDEAINALCSGAGRLGIPIAVVTAGKGNGCDGEQPLFTIRFETESGARLAEGVLLFAHILCELVEAELFGV